MPAEAPRVVRYEDESADAYVVCDSSDREVLVPKARETAQPSTFEPGRQTLAARLVLWSTFALVGVAVGGIGGVVLGVPVVIVAAMRLAEQARRIRRWRAEHAGAHAVPPLSAQASAERLRLRTAFWQGLVALVLGAVVFLFLSGRVL